MAWLHRMAPFAPQTIYQQQLTNHNNRLQQLARIKNRIARARLITLLIAALAAWKLWPFSLAAGVVSIITGI